MTASLVSHKSTRSGLRVSSGLLAGQEYNCPTPIPPTPTPPTPVEWMTCKQCNGQKLEPNTLQNAHCELCNF